MQRALTPLHREQPEKPDSMPRGFSRASLPLSLLPIPGSLHTPHSLASSPFPFISKTSLQPWECHVFPRMLHEPMGILLGPRTDPYLFVSSAFVLHFLFQDLSKTSTVPPGSPAATSLCYYFQKESADRQRARQCLTPRQE